MSEPNAPNLRPVGPSLGDASTAPSSGKDMASDVT